MIKLVGSFILVRPASIMPVSQGYVFPAHISLGIRVSPHTYRYRAGGSNLLLVRQTINK